MSPGLTSRLTFEPQDVSTAKSVVPPKRATFSLPPAVGPIISCSRRVVKSDAATEVAAQVRARADERAAGPWTAGTRPPSTTTSAPRASAWTPPPLCRSTCLCPSPTTPTAAILGGVQTVFEAAGGDEGLLRLASAWHARVMADEVVSHTFSHGFHQRHVAHPRAAGVRPFEYLDWWNHPRLHGEIGLIPPIQKETAHYAQHRPRNPARSQ